MEYNTKCYKDTNDGQCCCNCHSQVELFCHPWNTTMKGDVTKTTNLYACIFDHSIHGNHRATLMESKHGRCELWNQK